MAKLRQIIAKLLYVWPLPALLAVALISMGLAMALRPTWPVGEVIVDTPNPIAAPLSGQPVCGHHVCVEHPHGSTCLGRTWAEPLQFTAPDGTTGTAEVRWNAPEPNYEIVRGESQYSFNGLLVETDSERVRSRCQNAACTWTEMIIPCGTRHKARWHADGDTVSVERVERGLEGIASAWIIGITSLLLFMTSGILLLLFKFARRQN